MASSGTILERGRAAGANAQGDARISDAREPVAAARGQSFKAAVLLGIGLMAAVDEIIFHQLLGWHHFYDRSTPMIGLVSDGLLHAAELVAILLGGYWMLQLRGRGALHRAWALPGLLIGLGGFQLFDGIVDHKVLRLHQIRYGVPVLPYDLAWNGFALVLLAIGIALLVRARRRG
jgi:uncharacterized membrane protein